MRSWRKLGWFPLRLSYERYLRESGNGPYVITRARVGSHYVASYQRHLRESGDEPDVVTKVGVVSIAFSRTCVTCAKVEMDRSFTESEGRFKLRRFVPATLARKWRRAWGRDSGERVATESTGGQRNRNLLGVRGFGPGSEQCWNSASGERRTHNWTLWRGRYDQKYFTTYDRGRGHLGTVTEGPRP